MKNIQADFRLVINNARTFNPPDTIFYKEASRIELVGLDAIAQAAAQAIDMDVEPLPSSDEEDVPVKREETVDVYSSRNPPRAVKNEPEDVEMQDIPAKRVASIVPKPETPSTPAYRSFHQPVYQPKGRGPYRKTVMKEEPLVGPDGELPGSRYGVGAFPVGSEFGTIALALEIRGMHLKTLDVEKWLIVI